LDGKESEGKALNLGGFTIFPYYAPRQILERIKRAGKTPATVRLPLELLSVRCKRVLPPSAGARRSKPRLHPMPDSKLGAGMHAVTHTLRCSIGLGMCRAAMNSVFRRTQQTSIDAEQHQEAIVAILKVAAAGPACRRAQLYAYGQNLLSAGLSERPNISFSFTSRSTSTQDEDWPLSCLTRSSSPSLHPSWLCPGSPDPGLTRC